MKITSTRKTICLYGEVGIRLYKIIVEDTIETLYLWDYTLFGDDYDWCPTEYTEENTKIKNAIMEANQ